MLSDDSGHRPDDGADESANGRGLEGSVGPPDGAVLGQPADRRWIRLDDGRTFLALIRPNLWGEPTLAMAWGSVYGRAGGSKIENYPDMEQAIKRLTEVSRRRERHGYVDRKALPPGGSL